jgi:hypothetical protein
LFAEALLTRQALLLMRAISASDDCYFYFIFAMFSCYYAMRHAAETRSFIPLFFVPRYVFVSFRRQQLRFYFAVHCLSFMFIRSVLRQRHVFHVFFQPLLTVIFT